MAFPLLTGTTQTSSGVRVQLTGPVPLPEITPTRTWGLSTFTLYNRTSAGVTRQLWSAVTRMQGTRVWTGINPTITLAHRVVGQLWPWITQNREP